jgi:ABC-type lipoprotein export system ATPase subunit
MNLKSITVVGGHDKAGRKENIEELTISAGEIVGIVGPTGSGKSSIISDIEQIAQGDTFSGRRILFDGKVPNRRVRTDPRRKLVAQLSQTMNFLADMTVGDFILLHSKCRGIEPTGQKGRRPGKLPDGRADQPGAQADDIKRRPDKVPDGRRYRAHQQFPPSF